MSKEQRLAVFITQENQRKELEEKRKNEKKERDSWISYEEAVRNKLDEMEMNQLADKEYANLEHAAYLKMQISSKPDVVPKPYSRS